MHQSKTVESFPYNDTKEILKNDTGQLALVSLILNDNQRVNEEASHRWLKALL